MYNDKVISVFQHPKHTGEIKNHNAVGLVDNDSCGDIMKVFLKINDKDIIEDASFKTFGCAAAIASSSVAMDKIIGKSVNDALALDSQEIIDELGGLPTQKIHCSMLAKEAIAAAIDDYRKRQKRLAKKASKQAQLAKNAKTDNAETVKETPKIVEENKSQLLVKRLQKLVKKQEKTLDKILDINKRIEQIKNKK